MILLDGYAGLVNTVERLNASEKRARMDSKIRDTKMVMILVMKEKEGGGKMRCGWGQTRQGEGAIEKQMVKLCLPSKYVQKHKKEATMFDLDPAAERSTRN